MSQVLKIVHAGQHLQLHPLRAIYWEEAETLLLADLHLGKDAHFRRQGLAVPQGISKQNITNVDILLRRFQPRRVLFLGDLFHSDYNHIWASFLNFIDAWPDVSFELVMGNHDILPPEAYNLLTCHQPPLLEPPYSFSHYPLDEVPTGYYNFYGHLHPGVLLGGTGKHAIKLPCFHFGYEQAVLPAFGLFTGLAIVRPQLGERVFVIAEDAVVEASM